MRFFSDISYLLLLFASYPLPFVQGMVAFLGLASLAKVFLPFVLLECFLFYFIWYLWFCFEISMEDLFFVAKPRFRVS